MADINKEYLKDHKLFRIRNKNILVMLPLIAVFVAIAVFWCLKLVGITMTSEALCNLEEHSHSVLCYTDGELDCLKPEHRHSSECFPEKGVDVETSNDWKKTFENVTLSNDVSENLVSIAKTQIGYKESEKNFEYNAFAEKHSYTRYGEWYGSPYGEWNTLFVSFCVDYSNANDSDSLISASAETMRNGWKSKNLYFSAEEYDCSRGDVVFFDTGSDKRADRTGIVAYNGENILIVIEGDVDGEVKAVTYENEDSVLGFGKTSGLYAAQYFEETDEVLSEETETTEELGGRVHLYLPETFVQPVAYRMMRSAPAEESTGSDGVLMLALEDDHDIIYTSHLEDEVVAVVFKELSGQELVEGSTIYVGERYHISLEFSEINKGAEWIQFRHNEDGYLTYQLPEEIHCEPFDDWHTISAKTEQGTVKDVGEYFMDENGFLRVRFYENADGLNFVDKFSNVDFSIDFDATVCEKQAGSITDIKFSDKINLNLNVDGNASMQVTKTHGQYNANDHTMDYTLRVTATHGVVKNLVIDDQIWENHHTLKDTVVVTDLQGNLLDPQPTVSENPGVGLQAGSLISGFPDFSAGEGFIIKYKTQINDDMLANETVSMWNGVYSYGNNSIGGTVDHWTDDWENVELEKIVKDGNQTVVTDKNGNNVPVIEWEVEIRKDNHDLQGTVIIDTLGDGLEYFTDTPIRVEHYDQFGNQLPDTFISWNDVTFFDDSMSFALPEGYAFKIVYYTTYDEPEDHETHNYSNRITATINGREESTTGSAIVVGFVPHVTKNSSGSDGEYVYFTVEAEVPATIKDWGGFYLTDLAAFWGYKGNDEGFLYVRNFPEDVAITATTVSGQTVEFTPYQEGGTIENTFILVAPGIGDLEHSFNIFFNTATTDKNDSKWILSEDATLKITYKIPFDAKTGTEWTGELTGNLTVEELLFWEYTMANEAYLSYTNIITGTAATTYNYAPRITKHSIVNETGIIDYTVNFNNTIPGSNNNNGYINATSGQAVFHDTFDEKLHYVQDSLVVTTYSPWDKNLWVMKYRYTGSEKNNSIEAKAEDFVFLDYNEAAGPAWDYMKQTKDFREYCDWLSSGGRYEFTYQLMVEDEYLFTTDYAKFELDNTAEITWGNDGTSGPATNTSIFYTGLLHKHVHQDESKLDFEVHINRESLDIMEDSDTLTIQDTMSSNLSVYWDSIKLTYENENGEMIDFNDPASVHTYSVTYDPVTNALTFVVPDSLHIVIHYKTLITESGNVHVENAVLVDGKKEVADLINSYFRVQQHSGDASGSNHKFVLIKQDGLSNQPLEGAQFLLYGLKGDNKAVLPSGAKASIVTDKGETLKFIASYTTDELGYARIESQYLTEEGLYAFVEHVAPEGYEKLEAPIYFYFWFDDPDGKIQTVTTLLAVENFNGIFLIPETGGFGTVSLAIIGGALLVLPILYSLTRRKRNDKSMC